LIIGGIPKNAEEGPPPYRSGTHDRNDGIIRGSQFLFLEEYVIIIFDLEHLCYRGCTCDRETILHISRMHAGAVVVRAMGKK